VQLFAPCGAKLLLIIEVTHGDKRAFIMISIRWKYHCLATSTKCT